MVLSDVQHPAPCEDGAQLTEKFALAHDALISGLRTAGRGVPPYARLEQGAGAG
jgi:hypothetical protein